MSSISDAIEKGKRVALAGRSRRKSRFLSTPASPAKLIRLFNNEFTSAGYGEPLPLAKKTRGMMNGFIKLGRNNGWEDEYFYSIIREIVAHWRDLQGKEITTLNNKRVVLGDRPSLLEFLICRDYILSAMEEIKSRPDPVLVEEIQTVIEPEKTVTDPSLREPTEEELEQEYRDRMDELFE
jgi:hypothetical protein